MRFGTPKPQPKRVTVIGRVMSQIFGGLAGDAFVTSIESPKPLGKRARRRLRGRLKAERRAEKVHLDNIKWEF